MLRRHRITTVLFVMVVSSLLLAVPGIAAAGKKSHPPSKKTVGVGETWVVEKITRLQHLTIADGGVVTAAEGCSLTMTINGVETGGTLGINDAVGEYEAGYVTSQTQLLPGTYRGNIILTPTTEMLLNRGSPGPPGNEPSQWPFRTALYINDGALMPDVSVLSAVHGGPVTNAVAKNVRLRSTGDYFNGIMVDGDSDYVIRSPRIDFSGNGHDDFQGFGAAIRSSGDADVTVKNASIVTDGVVRTAVWVGGNSTMTVNDSYIKTGSGTYPYYWMGGPFPPGSGGAMLSVPWMLGITGNSRATNCLGAGTANYNRCYIEAESWGALSTDQCQDVHLNATDSVIVVKKSGYGAYADGTSLDTFKHCLFKVPDYGLIQTGGSGVFTDRTVVKSGRWGVMFHSSGSGTLTVDKGSVFKTGLAVFQVKSSYPTINVDHARLKSGNGLILQAMINDDPMAGGGGPPPGGDGPPAPPASTDTDVDANFSYVCLNGDIVNTMTEKGNVNVTLSHARLKGAITTGTQTPLAEWGIDNIQYVGMVTNEYEATAGPYGVAVALGAKAKWIVDETSYLNSLEIADGAVLRAPYGHTLTMTVDGSPTDVVPGTYTGAIVLTVN